MISLQRSIPKTQATPNWVATTNWYRRLAHAADVIRFAIEELTAELLLGACLEVDEERYDGGGIHRLTSTTP